ncbi:Gamma-1-syntrophin, partial [Sciurus carolinensis]|nr:Gamma-1-syntrophin [Sciurus carolinensis]
TKTGICLLQDGNQEPFKVRLHLAKDILIIQEQDVICVSGEPFYSGINGINVRKCRHEEVVQVLRNAGEEVTLTVSFLKRAPAFLKLPLNEDCACAPSDQSSGTSSPLCDSGLHLNYHPNNTDSDLLDRRKHCFTVQSESGEDLYFSVELECDLAQWERAFQTATFLEVERIQCKTYACVLESHLMGLTIDFSTGFICFDAATKAVLWRYKFSQLKGSSDDGKSKIKFLFQNPDTKQIEAKELEFSNLFAVLHCIHSFFAAKVACLDPLFLGNQATASAAASSASTSKAKYTT